MRTFTCDRCGQQIYFENDRCLRCLSSLGYVHSSRDVVVLDEGPDEGLHDGIGRARRWQYCSTRPVTGCNWLVPVGPDALCESCVLTRTRPADGDVEGINELVRGEMAKRRLVFQLAELDLPVTPRDEALGKGLAFDLLSSAGTKVVTGHDDGVITLDLAEADNEHRERLRQQLSEPYRTLLGHFRHEIGHYYWPILVDGRDALDTCRQLFGDDRLDYATAVQRHYDADPDSDDDSWRETHISRYATMHPYEDWAETFAHYLHILDTLQTADSFGLTAAAGPATGGSHGDGMGQGSPGGGAGFDGIVDDWLELSTALNQVNRSMGHEDLYPFVLAPTIRAKLGFVDRLVRHRPRPGPSTTARGTVTGAGNNT